MASNPESSLTDLYHFCASHGFDCRIDWPGRCVEVDIPWMNIRTRQKGIDRERVATIQEARNVLGY
jgi:hypothetical protein